MRDNPVLWIGAKEFYSQRTPEACIDFIEHWCITYDPRNAGGDIPTKLPFVLFDRQVDFVEFIVTLILEQVDGLVEKCRDMGATWLCAAISVWIWLYWPDAAIGWGSRKEALVDKIGDPKSIFDKIRMIIWMLPREMWPEGFSPRTHMTFMEIVNPENGSTITGESGDGIGRGGRTLVYFKDESAHYERPELIEASVSENTRVAIDISSVNGVGNVFHRRRQSGLEWEPGQKMVKDRANVFVMDWRDHPMKTQEWFDQRKAKFENDGLPHIFAQEVERNYSASIEGIVIKPEWVEACIGAKEKLLALGQNSAARMDDGGWIAAMDVADEGLDTNALGARKGVELKEVHEWPDRDPASAARQAIGMCGGTGKIEMHYDCIGVGAGVKGEANRLKQDKLWPTNIKLVPWNAAHGPINPLGRVIEGDEESPMNDDFYANLKAQGWWELGKRAWRTWRAVTQGVRYEPEELMSISPDLPAPILRKIREELSQPVAKKNTKLKMIIDKKPENTKSPNIGDTIMMVYWPSRAGNTGFLDMLESEHREKETAREQDEVQDLLEKIARRRAEKPDIGKPISEAEPEKPIASEPSAWMTG